MFSSGMPYSAAHGHQCRSISAREPTGMPPSLKMIARQTTVRRGVKEDRLRTAELARYETGRAKTGRPAELAPQSERHVWSGGAVDRRRRGAIPPPNEGPVVAGHIPRPLRLATRCRQSEPVAANWAWLERPAMRPCRGERTGPKCRGHPDVRLGSEPDLAYSARSVQPRTGPPFRPGRRVSRGPERDGPGLSPGGRRATAVRSRGLRDAAVCGPEQVG